MCKCFLLFPPVTTFVVCSKNIKWVWSGNTKITNCRQTHWHSEDEPNNSHEKPGRQTKQSNQLSLPHQDDCKYTSISSALLNLCHYHFDKFKWWPMTKILSEYNQEIPQPQTADKPMALRGRATQQSRDTRKTNKAKQPALSSPSRWLQIHKYIKRFVEPMSLSFWQIQMMTYDKNIKWV